MRFILNPLPHMEDQRFFPARSLVASLPYIGAIVRMAIDPTCGRYCLKSLLKWHKSVATGQPVTAIEVGHRYGPPPQFAQSGGRAEFALDYMLYLASNWIAYEPYVNFPDAEALLTQSLKPASIGEWQKLLYSYGPIILTGVLGGASVPHVILLVGVDYAGGGAFYFLDPLRGAALQNEAFAAMQPRIDDQIVHAKKNIGPQL